MNFEIILKTDSDNQVIRKIVTPTLQIGIHSETPDLNLSGKEEMKLQDGTVYTTQAHALFAREFVQLMPGQEATPEQNAIIAKNDAKEVAKANCFAAIKAAVTTYAQACFAIENPVNEKGVK